MRETWLAPNRRAIWFGCVPPLVLAGIGAWMALNASDPATGWVRPISVALMAVGLGLMGMLLWQLRRPRVAYENGQVLFYLRAGRPIAVPAQVVEAFFLGQGPVELPAVAKRHETVNLVARLSQRHTEWARQEVKPALGNWCESYVTIRGTWCEPLNTDVARRLNRRLHEVKTQK